jgi:hypothetical protein
VIYASALVDCESTAISNALPGSELVPLLIRPRSLCPRAQPAVLPRNTSKRHMFFAIVFETTKISGLSWLVRPWGLAKHHYNEQMLLKGTLDDQGLY